MKKSKVTRVAVERLELNTGQLGWLPRNPRQWKQADIDKMVRSLEEDPDFVEERPVLAVPGEGTALVVFAHNLLTTAARIGKVKTLPTVIYEPESDGDRETIIRRAIKDNGSMGSWDTDELANWGLDQETLSAWGVPDFVGSKDEPEENKVKEDNFDPEKDEIHVICQRGDIWELGDHRLMCGDSISLEEVQQLCGGGGR